MFVSLMVAVAASAMDRNRGRIISILDSIIGSPQENTMFVTSRDDRPGASYKRLVRSAPKKRHHQKEAHGNSEFDKLLRLLKANHVVDTLSKGR